MFGKREQYGTWWLPEQPDSKISGILKLKQNGAELELIGCFDKEKLLGPIIIHGNTVNGDIITLNNCIQTALNITEPGGTISKFEVDTVYAGVHFSNIKTMTFKKMFVNFSYLDDWLNLGLFKTSLDTNEIKIFFKQPTPIIAKLTNGYEIRLTTRRHFSSGKREERIGYTSFFVIVPPEGKTINELNKIIQTLRNFLTFAIGVETSEPLIVEGYEQENKKVEIIKGIPINDYTDIMQGLMVFPFDAVSHDFNSYLNRWFDASVLLKTVFELFFGTKNNPDLYVDNKFINYMIAIEAFHRIEIGGCYLSEKDYDFIRKRLIEAIPSEVSDFHRSSLKSKIRFGFEYSMRKRIDEITEKYANHIKSFIENGDDFREKVVETRNHMIHSSESNEMVCEGEDLVLITKQMELLLEICLLKKIGFSDEKLNEMTKKPRYQLAKIKQGFLQAG